MIKIAKFGGSSVADAEHFKKIKPSSMPTLPAVLWWFPPAAAALRATPR